MYITKEQLSKVIQLPKDVDEWIMYLNIVIEEYGFKEPKETAAFIATLLHESAGLSRFTENLNYSAEALARVWPKRFRENGKPNKLALLIQRHPEAIANNVYANRMGNGDVNSGEGYLYRGRGPIQNTGKAAALWLNNTIGKKLNVDFVKNFDLLTKPLYGMHAAAQYWIERVRPTLNKHTQSTNKVYMDAASDMVNLGHYTSSVGDAIGFADRFTKFEKVLPICEEVYKETGIRM